MSLEQLQISLHCLAVDEGFEIVAVSPYAACEYST
jgi:hypothetical protein